MLKSFFAVFGFLVRLLKYPFFLLCGLVFLFIVSCTGFFIYQLVSGNRLKKGRHKKLKKTPLLKKVFYDAPKMYVQDMFDRDPDFFAYQGLVIYTGVQGQGKTIAMINDCMNMQKEYPLCKCITNLAYERENDALTDWHQLIDYKNGIYGVIVCMDEIQNWFSSKQSKDFPPEMFEVVTQNRKNRRIILATTQNFYQPAKDVRAQCTLVKKCMTVCGVFTIVHAVRPVLDSSGDVKEWKHVKFSCFAHTKELRDSYDTYKVIESLAKSGFKEKTSVNTNTVYINMGGKKSK